MNNIKTGIVAGIAAAVTAAAIIITLLFAVTVYDTVDCGHTGTCEFAEIAETLE